MQNKIKRIAYSFRHEVQKQKVNTSLKTELVTVGYLQITGECSFHPEHYFVDERYLFTIDSIVPEDSNIAEIIESTTYQEIETATLKYIISLFHSDDTNQYPIENVPITAAVPVFSLIESMNQLFNPKNHN